MVKMLKIKKTNLILGIISVVLLIVTALTYSLSLNEHKRIFEDDESRIAILKSKLKMIDSQMVEATSEEKNNAVLYAGLEKADKSFYYFKDKNKFINDFSIMLKEVKGIEIYKVEYSKSDAQKLMRIGIPFSGSYKAIRELIYRIESRFYFIKIDGLNISEAEDGTLKGMIEIRAYFGDDSSEEK